MQLLVAAKKMALMLMLLITLLPLATCFHASPLPNYYFVGSSSTSAAAEAAVLKNKRQAMRSKISSRSQMMRFAMTSVFENDDEGSSWQLNNVLVGVVMSSFLLTSSPQFAEASSLGAESCYSINQQQQLITSTSRASLQDDFQGSSPLLLSLQLPFQQSNNDFQADRDARNRAYDEMFQQDARDRDAYYGKMALKKSESALVELKERREEMGLDTKASASPFAQVETMDSLTQYLMNKDPNTMTAAEFKEFKVLQRRAELQQKDNKNDGKVEAAQEKEEPPVTIAPTTEAAAPVATEDVTATVEDASSTPTPTETVVKVVPQKEQAPKEEKKVLTYEEKVQAKREFLRELQEQKDQKTFEDRMDVLDTFMTRKERMRAQSSSSSSSTLLEEIRERKDQKAFDDRMGLLDAFMDNKERMLEQQAKAELKQSKQGSK